MVLKVETTTTTTIQAASSDTTEKSAGTTTRTKDVKHTSALSLFPEKMPKSRSQQYVAGSRGHPLHAHMGRSVCTHGFGYTNLRG